jgi:hypothetical protein
MTTDYELLSIKELAGELGKNRTYIHAMKRHGFQMPGGRATVPEARAWLVRNPPPRSGKPFVVVAFEKSQLEVREEFENRGIVIRGNVVRGTLRNT